MTQGNNPKFCGQCGSAIAPNDRFCSGCGVSIYNASEKTDSYSLQEHVDDISLFQKILKKPLFFIDALFGFSISDFIERAGISKVRAIVVLVVVICFWCVLCYFYITWYTDILLGW